MLINKNYRLEADELNILLQKKHTVQKGKTEGNDTWTTIGYYGSAKSALSALAEVVTRENMKSLDKLNAALNRLSGQIGKLTKGDLPKIEASRKTKPKPRTNRGTKAVRTKATPAGVQLPDNRRKRKSKAS